MANIDLNREITAALGEFRDVRDHWERDWAEMVQAVTEQLIVMRDHYLAGRTREAYAAASVAADLEFEMLGDRAVVGVLLEKFEKELGIEPDEDPEAGPVQTSV